MTRLTLVLTVTALTFAVAVGQLSQPGILECPTCTDPYDSTTCTGKQTCHNTIDVCELRVHLTDKNRIEYVCINSHACTNHEAHTCDVTTREACWHCCKDLDTCKTQREQLFSTVYTTASSGGMTTMATSNVTMASGNGTAMP